MGLIKWRQLRRSGIYSSSDPNLQIIIEASGTGELLEITYEGGSTPGKKRMIAPVRVYRAGNINRIYIEAFCVLRNDIRTFNYELLMLHENNNNKKYITDNRKIKRFKSSQYYDLSFIIALLLMFALIICWL